ncbi:type ISP restriction/modification enzyme [Azotobacter vinelandii]
MAAHSAGKKTFADFQAFSQAGRKLGELHVNYESVPMYAGVKINTGNKPLTDADYRVEKMKYGKKRQGQGPDRPTLQSPHHHHWHSAGGL